MLSVGLRFARSCVAASTRPGSVATMRTGHLVLDREDILELADRSVRPQICRSVSASISCTVTRMRPPAFRTLPSQDVIDGEFARDVLHLHRLALVHKGRVAGDHEQVVEA